MLEFKICTFYSDGNVFKQSVLYSCEPWYRMECATPLKTDQHQRASVNVAGDCKLLPCDHVGAVQSSRVQYIFIALLNFTDCLCACEILILQLCKCLIFVIKCVFN